MNTIAYRLVLQLKPFKLIRFSIVFDRFFNSDFGEGGGINPKLELCVYNGCLKAFYAPKSISEVFSNNN